MRSSREQYRILETSKYALFRNKVVLSKQLIHTPKVYIYYVHCQQFVHGIQNVHAYYKDLKQAYVVSPKTMLQFISNYQSGISVDTSISGT